MTSFRYEAARADGARVRGRADARSAAEVTASLSERGLFALDVREIESARAPVWRRPGTRTLATAVQALAALVEAGVPLHRALAATRHLTDGMLCDALARVEGRVREGSTLAGALADEGGLFPPVTIGLIRAGERGVGLAPALAQAARQLERDAEARASLRAALAYPLVVLVVGSLSIGVILLVVLPRFAMLLANVEGSLPPATRFLLSASALLRAHPAAAALVGAALAGVVVTVVARYREAWAMLLLDAPVVGAIRHALGTARVARALGALFGTGVSALPALSVAQDAAGDPALRARLAAARERVAQGAGLGDALAATHALTPAAIQLVRVGEGSGRLAELLLRAAELEEQVARRRLQALLTALEPALILGFAALVAFIAGALLQAVYAVRPGGL